MRLSVDAMFLHARFQVLMKALFLSVAQSLSSERDGNLGRVAYNRHHTYTLPGLFDYRGPRMKQKAPNTS